MEKFGTTATTGKQRDSINIYAEIYRRRQVVAQRQGGNKETGTEGVESPETFFELFPEDGYELTVLKMCGEPSEVVDVRPDTEIREVKRLLGNATGIPSEHQRYLWFSIILGELVTMRELGNPTILELMIDVIRSCKLPFRRPSDNGLCENELMYCRRIVCGMDGSFLHKRSMVWVVRTKCWPDASTGLKRIDYFHSNDNGELFASMMIRSFRGETFGTNEIFSAENGHVLRCVIKIHCFTLVFQCVDHQTVQQPCVLQ